MHVALYTVNIEVGRNYCGIDLFVSVTFTASIDVAMSNDCAGHVIFRNLLDRSNYSCKIGLDDAVIVYRARSLTQRSRSRASGCM